MSSENNQDAAEQKKALLAMIADKKKEDPLIGLKIGADEVKNRVFAVFTSDKGVNIDAVLTVLSALAGFACQMAIREDLINTGKVKEEQAMMRADVKDGKTYFIGGLLNDPLIEDELSVWSLVAGAVTQNGGTPPELKDIADYSAKTLGTPDFGKPRYNDAITNDFPPQELLADIWPALCPVMDDFCDTAMQRPALLGIALNQSILQAKDVIAPDAAATMVMDIAVAMSKLDPKSIGVKIKV